MSIPVIEERGLIIPKKIGVKRDLFTSIVFSDEDGITLDLYNDTSSDVTVHFYIDDIELKDTLGATITAIIPANGGLSFKIYWDNLDPTIKSQILVHGYHTIEIRDASTGQPYDRVGYLYYKKGTTYVRFVDENNQLLHGNLAVIDARKGFYRILYDVDAVIEKPSQGWDIIYVFWKTLNSEFYYGAQLIYSVISDTTIQLKKVRETFLHIRFEIPREQGIKGLLQIVGWTWGKFILERDILPLLEFICRRLGLPLYSVDFNYDDQFLYVTLVIKVTREDFGSWIVRAVIIGGLILLITTIIVAGYIVGVWTSSQAVISTNESRNKITQAVSECIQSCLEDTTLTDQEKIQCVEACTSFGKSITSTLQPPPEKEEVLPSWFWTLLAIILLVGILMMFRR